MFVLIILAKNIQSQNAQYVFNYQLIRTARDTEESDSPSTEDSDSPNTEDSDSPSGKSDLFQIYPFHEDIPLKAPDFDENDSFFNEDSEDFFYDDLDAVESFRPIKQETNKYHERSVDFYDDHLKNSQPLLRYNNIPLDRSERHNPDEVFNQNDNLQLPQQLQQTTKFIKRVTVDDIGVPVVPVKLKIIK
ncbi:unnamed protein product, partial [Meganyctiphanes norvegica]